MSTAAVNCDIKNIELADLGKKRIEWANQSMKVLQIIRKEFIKNQPLKGIRVSACLHVTAETANLAHLPARWRRGQWCSAPRIRCPRRMMWPPAWFATTTFPSTPLRARTTTPTTTISWPRSTTSRTSPWTTAPTWSRSCTPSAPTRSNFVIGGTEETTTGVIRLRAMAKEGVLKFPIVAVNDADTKHLFDNRYGTGQSTIDGIIRATNFLLAGSKFVVAGYGWCGRGLASRARGAGAEVIVTEVDPTKALEAVMDGFRVMSMTEAAKLGDVFCTVTGNKSVLTKDHFALMKDGAIISNSGHFNVEIDIPALENMSSSKRTTRASVEEYSLKDGRKINLLGEGRLINLASAEGHPASVMDMSFADQALSVEYMVKNAKKLEKTVYKVPDDLDKRVAKLKLESMSIKIDKLTPEQEEYLAGWSEGT